MIRVLRDLDESIPLEYSFVSPCSENSLERSIEKTASFVSRVYAKFPKLQKTEREQFMKLGMTFNQHFPLTYPAPESECEQFEEALKKRVVATLKQDSMITLSTDNGPEEILYDVCNSVFKNTSNLGFLFPQKTLTSIKLNKNNTELRLDMRFSSSNYI